MDINNNNNAVYLNGVLDAISVFCDDTDFVSMYGAICLEPGSSRDRSVLVKGLNIFSPNTIIDSSEVVEWSGRFNFLFNKWVKKKLLTDNSSVSMSDRIEQLYELIYEKIESGGEVVNSLHICLTGDNWEYDAECLVLDYGNECYALYFMYSD